MAKKKNKIEIPDHSFIEDCIWMSYRYCIGRSTIAAAMHAPQIAKFLEMNPTVLSGDRKEFMAKDIRQEISDVLRWRSDIHVDGFSRETDVATLIMKHIVENRLDTDKDWDFKVDLQTGTVTSQPAKEKPITRLSHDINDLLPWIKLANWLDPKEQITYQYEGKTETEPGFTFYTLGREVTAHQVTCNAYIKNPYIDTYIDPKYILTK